MREMFFRAISKKTGEFVYGVPAPNSFGKYIFMVCLTLDDTCAYPMSKLPDFCEEIIPETLGEYSGVRDGTGEFIFEGDSVEFCDFDSLRTGGNTSDKTRKAKVVFIQGGYFVKNGDYEALLYDALINDSDLKIIGNVWEEGDVLNDRENSEGN